jgi:hypothetical protein
MARAQVGNDDMETAQPDRLDGNSVANPKPSHEAIARRAYELWEERGRTEGSQEEDWFRRGTSRAPDLAVLRLKTPFAR